tara:strand:+ start:176 stop:730 length:555 start_codon:yes stop_codon:yes gene_type:complete
MQPFPRIMIIEKNGMDLEGSAAVAPAGLWEGLPVDLWERIFHARSDTAALCFELNRSLKATAQAYLLSHNILPRSLLRLQAERECFKKDLCRALALSEAKVLAKGMRKTSSNRRSYDPSTSVQPLLEENGGLPALQKRLARKRRMLAERKAEREALNQQRWMLELRLLTRLSLLLHCRMKWKPI